MDYTFRPIERWPRDFTKDRRHDAFDSTYSQTLKLLEYELGKLNARNIVIQADLKPADIRNDGLMRANARPGHPGIILAFEKWIPNGKRNERGAALGTYKPFSMPCDTFTDWTANLRAIALTLEALRKIDRYGVSQNAEQYTGWAALPAPAGNDIRFDGDDAAARFIAQYSDVLVADVLVSAMACKSAYRAAAARLHPDHGGDTENFQRLQSAKAMLDKRHQL